MVISKPCRRLENKPHRRPEPDIHNNPGRVSVTYWTMRQQLQTVIKNAGCLIFSCGLDNPGFTITYLHPLLSARQHFSLPVFSISMTAISLVLRGRYRYLQDHRMCVAFHFIDDTYYNLPWPSSLRSRLFTSLLFCVQHPFKMLRGGRLFE